MDGSLSLKINEHEFWFDHRRAIYWPEKKILLAADLHWGKTGFYQRHGIAIPEKVFDDDLSRLSELISDYGARTVLVLGDLLHHEKSLSRGTVEKVATFREQHPCEFILVKGNHDRYVSFPQSWGIVEEKEMIIGNFLFTHEHVPQDVYFQFSGHIHPMFVIKAAYDRIRLPAFIMAQDHCLLPAFSQFTGGQDVKLTRGQRALVVMADGLETFQF